DAHVRPAAKEEDCGPRERVNEPGPSHAPGALERRVTPSLEKAIPPTWALAMARRAPHLRSGAPTSARVISAWASNSACALVMARDGRLRGGPPTPSGAASGEAPANATARSPSSGCGPWMHLSRSNAVLALQLSLPSRSRSQT